MKIKCIFCGEWINNPTMERVTCGRKECRKEYSKEYLKEYRKEHNKDPENRKKKREYMKKYMKKHSQLPEVKKYQRAYVKTYHQALYKLRNNHREEFREIHKKLKRRKKNE